MPLAVVPMNLPSSSVTIGPEACIVGAAKTVAAAAQMIKSKLRKEGMAAREERAIGMFQPTGTSEHLYKKKKIVLL